MKKLDLFFATILVPLDYVALILAAIAAYSLRFAPFLAERRPVIFALPFDQYMRIVFIIAIGWITIYALSGLYAISHRKKLEELKKIIIASTAAFGGVLAAVVFSRELFESRFILLASWIFAIVFVFFFRLFLRMVRSTLIRAGFGLKLVAVIGKGMSADALINMVSRNPKYGLKVAFRAETFSKEAERELRALAAQDGLDQIIYVAQNGSTKEMHEALDFADEYHLSFCYSADIVSAHGAGIEFDMLAGVPLLELKRTRLEGWGRVYKRIFDIVGSLILILITLPIIFFAALAVMFESGFPILFRNERVGEHGKIFNTLKFRTMYQKYCIGKQFADHAHALEYEKKLIAERSDKQGPVYKIKEDPRVTHVGRFLRRTSIDELPQLFNVLAGQMTLVGPRPHQRREVEKYEKHHKRVLELKPGMTGLPQISGRSDLSFEEEVKLDTYYIEHWSLKLDFIILLKTPFAVLGQRGTY
ncbi:hypothetical protein A3B21_01055 [Candidatus Uhrbacteria bacterium RIFCSPLOWO2_01_FULL_47_24]|uniref:Bacterial sugar transferase domain-containing protein n=1 Tax=Candidatus Uhrbacteria bacterium RIFCSPLOWO2_01_FULL_47_24 TaxID=1802401 RepID=A0A1F7UQJ4_9BACT|nr:MAG: hypothetical protein A2753_02170 [Candidatus Uhrbacteria bacterium RIFCSPHIGHO2_01_FULL_47_11]OGL67765.1 MAG: hypothetical protein A3D58_01225 [Candidatus Uhrbacteria bacterium RIFCSPHIGHO2_02_FULL_46_47]OGL76654.1 MAG: hypothetical protein A3F52_03750 [Candidatus Uhrbacteria bacterium RIFCSPHIGHO2_12_FULL_47_11]OGL79978.1 MAG: hypothetical protein A3B21_01055 [Candidatus Uhrbacteria bacterium RIFCSPLOWO2_01_FULL_47_24]OGL84359.1 MAG: hypothetical protein A3J03_00530 [Candidatus Uhrbact